MNEEEYKFTMKMLRIGSDAVKKAQEENRRLGLPNVYSLNGKKIYQMPDGSVRDSYDFTKNNLNPAL